MTDTKMYVPVQEHIRLVAEAYDKGHEQAKRDLCALYEKAKAPEWVKTGPGGPIGPYWEAE